MGSFVRDTVDGAVLQVYAAQTLEQDFAPPAPRESQARWPHL